MPNDYSIQIHDFLNKQLNLLEQKRKKASKNTDNKCKTAYLDGQHSEILWLRDYFKENTDLQNHKYY